MDFSKKGLLAGIGCLALLVGLSLLRSVHFGFHAPGPILNCVVFNAIYVGWGISMFRRFPQARLRNYMALVVASFVLLNLLRAAKYTFVVWDGDVARHLWYFYYTPVVFGAVLLFQAALHLGQADDYKAPKRWFWLFLPPALLSVCIAANDLHQLCFRFAPDFANWYSDYTYGPFYYAAVGWIGLMAVGTVFLCVKSAVSRRLMKTVWFPLLVLFLSIVFGLSYVFGQEGTLFGLLFGIVSLPDYICLCTIAFWESLVAARVMTSNTEYPAVFAASSLCAGLTDVDFQVQQTSMNAIIPPQEALRKAKNSELLLPDGDTLLKVRPVQGGWFYWTEDVAELRRLNKALDDVGEELAEESEMLRLVAEMEENRRITLAKIRLYDSVNDSLRPQLNTITGWLDTLPQNETAFRKVIGRVGVLLAYCKRRSGLLLQAEAHPVLTSEELRICFMESAKALALCDIPCVVTVGPAVHSTAQDAAALYESFENVLEEALTALRRVDAALTQEADGATVFHLTLTLIHAEETTLQRLRDAETQEQRKLEPAGVRFLLTLEDAETGGEARCD